MCHSYNIVASWQFGKQVVPTVVSRYSDAQVKYLGTSEGITEREIKTVETAESLIEDFVRSYDESDSNSYAAYLITQAKDKLEIYPN